MPCLLLVWFPHWCHALPSSCLVLLCLLLPPPLACFALPCLAFVLFGSSFGVFLLFSFLFFFTLVCFSLPCLAFILFSPFFPPSSSSLPLCLFRCLSHSICQTVGPNVNTVRYISAALLQPTSSVLFFTSQPSSSPLSSSSSYAELGPGRSGRGRHRASQGHVAEGHLGTAPLSALLACLGRPGDD